MEESKYSFKFKNSDFDTEKSSVSLNVDIDNLKRLLHKKYYRTNLKLNKPSTLNTFIKLYLKNEAENLNTSGTTSEKEDLQTETTHESWLNASSSYVLPSSESDDSPNFNLKIEDIIEAAKITSQPGDISRTAELLLENITIDRLKTLDSINSAFLVSLKLQNSQVTREILLALASLPKSDVYPSGQTMAIAAMSSRHDEIVEAGINAFELWDDPESADYLKSLHLANKRLHSYLQEVIEDLGE